MLLAGRGSRLAVRWTCAFLCVGVLSATLVLALALPAATVWASHTGPADARRAAVPVTASLAAPTEGVSERPSLFVDGLRQDTLVRVQVSSPEGWEILRSLAAELYLRGDGYAVVKLKPGDLAFLDSTGLPWKTLSVGVQKPLFYLIPGRGSPPVSDLDVLVLDQDREGVLVTGPREAAAAAIARGYMAVPLDRTWPANPAGFHGLRFVHDDEIVRSNYVYHLIRSVSPDNLGAYIQHLEDYGTRHSDSIQITRAGRWLVNTLGGFGYPDTLFESIDFGKGTATKAGNVMGSKPGLAKPDFHIVVGGHYDSITYNEPVSPLIDAPGADDNASGTAGTLEIARLLADVDLDATVQFLLFSGEEQGLHGSRRFATQLAVEGVPEDRLFFFNMDMIGNEDVLPWDVKLYYNTPSLPLAQLAARVADAYTRLKPVMAGHTDRSDHASLQQVGYAAIMAHEGDFSPHYHGRDDLLIHLEMDYCAEVVRMVMATVLHLANLAEPPSAVTAAETVSGEVRVEWTHSTDADVVGYHVEILNPEGDVTDEIFVEDNYVILGPPAIESADLADGVYVRVRAEDVLGESEASELVLVGGRELLTARANSNPTSGRTEFDLFIPGSGSPVTTTVAIVDAAGRLVRTLHRGALSRGSHTVEWDGSFNNGSAVPPGIYFLVVDAEGVGVRGEKIMIVR